MKTPRLLTWVSLLALLGAGIAAYQTAQHFQLRSVPQSFTSFCSVNEVIDCDAVQLSHYSEVFPGVPLAGMGLGWFVALLILTIIARNPFKRKDALQFAWIMASVGSLVSIAYAAIMIGILKKHCLLCWGIDLINWSSFFMLLTLHRSHKNQAAGVGRPFLTYSSILGGCLVVMIAISWMVNSNRPSVDLVEREVQKILARTPESLDLSDGHLVIGPNNAPITIVKFSDYQCPACRMGALTLHPAMKRYEGKVRLVLKNFPLNARCNPSVNSEMHRYSCQAAKAILCAESSGRVLPVYQAFFENQATLSDESIRDLSLQNGVPSQDYDRCIKSPETESLLQKQVAMGSSLQIRSTPTFFINGYRIEGFLPSDVWNVLIEHFLNAK